MSPVPGRSTLITSAPNQARSWVQVGPDWTWVKSRMRTPSSALVMSGSGLRSCRGCESQGNAPVERGERKGQFHAVEGDGVLRPEGLACEPRRTPEQLELHLVLREKGVLLERRDAGVGVELLAAVGALSRCGQDLGNEYGFRAGVAVAVGRGAGDKDVRIVEALLLAAPDMQLHVRREGLASGWEMREQRRVERSAYEIVTVARSHHRENGAVDELMPPRAVILAREIILGRHEHGLAQGFSHRPVPSSLSRPSPTASAPSRTLPFSL